MAGTFGETTVVMRGPALAELLRGPNGPVVRAMIKFGDVVKAEAIAECPVYDPPPAGPFRARAPGTLKRSIVKRVTNGPQGVSILVGSDDPVALWVHEGTRPHVIRPVRAKMLAFWSEDEGAVVFAREVHHPGTQPNRFLFRALAAAKGRIVRA